MIFDFYFNNIQRYDLSNLEKYKAVETICRLEKAKAKLESHKSLKDRKNNLSSIDKTFKNNNFLSDKLLRVLDCLCEDSKHIIINEFFENSGQLWYEDFYSKTTYYKKRKFAVEEFLSYYIDYNI
ncbi:MG284/MPN403 family protein [Mycoplasmopsis felifaucium]|uniref:MG284/MPN403 family protein n=1 Tax=Mycoplasmopsis felifaucium TaxID=35768 RepID=UPI00048347A0|nr:hypothetical protein [Mycoplasmopsis felifaucium]